MAAETNLPSAESRLAAIMKNGKYSDLVLACKEGKEFKVHKILLDIHSTYFRDLFNGDGKESLNSRVEVEEGYRVISAMLDFIYKGSYANVVKENTLPEKLQLHIDVYIAADFYGVSNLGEYARKRFVATAESDNNWESTKKAWPAIVDTVYEPEERIPAIERIKTDILRITWDHIHALEEEQEFKDLLANVGAFAADLFELSRSQLKRPDLISTRCTACEKSINVVLNDQDDIYCPQCGSFNYYRDLRKRRRIRL